MINIHVFVKCSILPPRIQSSTRKNKYILNPYDIYALKQTIKLKSIVPCHIKVISMGPYIIGETLKRYLAWGIDDIVVINDKVFSGSDTYATSYTLSRAIEHIGKANLYVFGEKSIDGETGQVPIGFSSRMNINCIRGTKKIESITDDSIELHIQEDNALYLIAVDIPCAIVFSGYSNQEPVLNLFELKRCFAYCPTMLDANTINIDPRMCGSNGSKTVVIKTSSNSTFITPRNKEIISGTPKEKADFVRKLITKVENL